MRFRRVGCIHCPASHPRSTPETRSQTLEEVERVTFTDTGLEAELKAKRKSGLTCVTCSAILQPEWLDCPYCMTPRFQD